MDHDTTPGDARPGDNRSGDNPSGAGHGGGDDTAADPLAEARTLLDQVRMLTRQYTDLVALEVRRAGISITTMLVLAVCVAVLGIATWVLICATIAVALVHAGLPLAAGLLLLALLNAAAAVGALLAIRASSHGLTFPATRRTIGAGETAKEDDHARSVAHA